MRVTSVSVGPFRSIDKEQVVEIDEDVTVLVGMNEAGKTVFLQSLRKTNDVLGLARFEPVDDYPRKNLNTYQKRHGTSPEEVVTIRYALNEDERKRLAAAIGVGVPDDFSFSITTDYANDCSIGLHLDERAAVAALANRPDVSGDARSTIGGATTLQEVVKALRSVERTDSDDAFLTSVQARIGAAAKAKWSSAVCYEAWTWLSGCIPKFAFFGDYEILPGKMNLTDLATRVGDAATLTPADRGVLALLRMADVTLDEVTKSSAYEPLKAKLESVSISLSDQVFEFWKQNEDLEVEVDIRPDSADSAPFNSGPNLYLRIKNRRHRGVSTSFDQRSRGFVWFFSFLVWFDEVQHQLDPAGKVSSHQLVLLLDEPGLSLHALAQADLLRYIDKLAADYQVIYTTHSPFMVHSDRLGQVRIVEDRKDVGTVITSELSGSNARTVFPLQAALGWTIAQNLFIGRRNLLVEGASELAYLNLLSAALERAGKRGLRDDVTLVPVGGLDKVATFIALLGANELELVVLHDYRGAPEQKLADLVREKIIRDRAILTPAPFRAAPNTNKASDIEDLFDESMYLEAFTKAYAKPLKGATMTVAGLPPGDRIVDRIERDLATRGITVRPSGGFNHYVPAAYLAANPPTFDAATLKRFAALFDKINGLFSP
jgi:hypothetical protein